MTRREFARRHRVSLLTVTRWKQSGYIEMTRDGRIDAERSDALLAQRPRWYRGDEGPAWPDASVVGPPELDEEALRSLEITEEMSREMAADWERVCAYMRGEG